MTKEYANAFLTLAKDTDDDIRWSVFYDITQFTSLFTAFKNEFLEASQNAMNDYSNDVSKQAKLALKALKEN